MTKAYPAFFVLIFGASSAMVQQQQQIEHRIPSLHSRSSLKWVKGYSDNGKSIVNPRLVDHNYECEVIDKHGETVFVSKKAFGLLDSLKRWKHRPADQPVHVRNFSADQMLRYDNIVTSIQTGNSASAFKKIKTNQLCILLRNLERLWAPKDVMSCVAREIVARRSQKPFLLDQRTNDLLNAYYDQPLSDIERLVLTGQRWMIGAGIVNLRSLGLRNLQGLESITDLANLNTTVAGLNFGNISPDDVDSLLLDDNYLTEITEKDVATIQQIFPNLEQLTLRNNRIHTIHKSVEKLRCFIELENNPLELDKMPSIIAPTLKRAIFHHYNINRFPKETLWESIKRLD